MCYKRNKNLAQRLHVEVTALTGIDPFTRENPIIKGFNGNEAGCLTLLATILCWKAGCVQSRIDLDDSLGADPQALNTKP